VFTGIVGGVGRVVALRNGAGSVRLTIRPPKRERLFRRGESVSVSGVCLTSISGGRLLTADVSPETLSRTTLGALARGDRVNLERSLRWGDRVSGHFVLGHVDAVCRILSVRRRGSSWTYRFSIPPGRSRFVVEKGSVALDGISLTVGSRRARDFDVAVIPETRRRTTLASKDAGSLVNFEADPLARYGRVPSGGPRKTRR
jgi:riboflavin synthase